MKTIITSTATALALIVGMSGNADATPLIDNSSNATAVALQGQLQGQAQQQQQRQNQRQNQLQGQLQGQGQDQGQSIDQNFTYRKTHNSAPGLALGSVSAHGGFYNGAVRNACVGSRGQGWMAGVTTGIDNGTVTGGGLGFGRSTTEETIAVQCEIGEQATELMKVGMEDAAQKMQCMSIFKRQTIDAMDPAFCAGIPVVGASFARFEDTQLINMVQNIPVEQTSRPVSFVPQQVVAPKPAGNATGGRCTNGFDYTTGQCAKVKVQAFVSDLRHDG